MFTVAPHCQIIDQLGLIDSSRKLVSVCVISLCLMLQISVQISDMIGNQIGQSLDSTSVGAYFLLYKF
jgi:hypothetical protein